MNKTAVIASIILLLSASVSSSCGTGNGSGAAGAERQLERTLHAVNGKKLPYEASSEVKLAGTTMQHIRAGSTGSGDTVSEWNPDEILELLSNVRKTVEFEDGRDEGKAADLRVEVDQADWKRAVEAHFKQQLLRKKTEENNLVNSYRNRLPPEQAASMEKELQHSVSLAEDRLNRILGTLKANGSCRIIVDRRTNLPMKMTLENAMQYEDNGKRQEEIVIDSYVFH